MSARPARTVALAAALATALATGATIGAAPAASAAPGPSRSAAVAVAKDHGSTDFGYAAATTTRNGTRYLTFDRAVLLTGAKARAAKAAHGLDPDDAPGFFIQNDNRKLRTYQLSATVRVYGTQQLARSGTPRPVSMKQFVDFVGSRASARTPFTLTFQDGKVVRIAETYLA
jgi:hypothetical protein